MKSRLASFFLKRATNNSTGEAPDNSQLEWEAKGNLALDCQLSGLTGERRKVLQALMAEMQPEVDTWNEAAKAWLEADDAEAKARVEARSAKEACTASD